MLQNGLRGLDRNAIDIGHGGGLGRDDLLFGGGDLGVEVGFERVATRIGLGGKLGMRGLADGDRLGLGVGQRLFMRGGGGGGFVLRLGGGGEIRIDLVLARRARHCNSPKSR